MPATIRIESGIAAGTNYWIDRPVLRVGSDPGCEICLPTADLAPHALTLEFRGGIYRAYNRGASPIRVGATTLPAGGSGVWNDGDTVALGGGQQLVLAIDGDPRPTPQPDAGANDGYSDAPAIMADESNGAALSTGAAAAKKSSSSSTMQLAIIGLCVVGIGGLLLLNQIGGLDAAPAANRPTFTQIVTDSLKKDDVIRTFVQKLQVAESFIVRGNPELAKTDFANFRDQIMRRTDSLSEADRKDADAIRQYAEFRLGQQD
ncbi:MAG TPA: hypothetical protein VH107_03840 [Lacipirellulaceae bacterium]|nr:hypothetical protein [Lacipirellulaceae bacterium]